MFVFYENLFDAVFTGSDASQMPVLWFAHKVLGAIVANGYPTAATVMLPVEKVKRMLTDKARFNLSRSPNRSLADSQKFYPDFESLLTKILLSLFLLDINRDVELTCLLSVLARWILYLNLKAKIRLLNFD